MYSLHLSIFNDQEIIIVIIYGKDVNERLWCSLLRQEFTRFESQQKIENVYKIYQLLTISHVPLVYLGSHIKQLVSLGKTRGPMYILNTKEKLEIINFQLLPEQLEIVKSRPARLLTRHNARKSKLTHDQIRPSIFNGIYLKEKNLTQIHADLRHTDLSDAELPSKEV